ncbi:hypothetical protein GDO81_028573, partial [Engystomops pustulosus]
MLTLSLVDPLIPYKTKDYMSESQGLMILKIFVLPGRPRVSEEARKRSYRGNLLCPDNNYNIYPDFLFSQIVCVKCKSEFITISS